MLAFLIALTSKSKGTFIMPPSKSQVPPHYSVTIQGTFYAKTEKGKEVLPYELVVNVPVKVKAPVIERVFNKDKEDYDYIETIKEQKIDDVGILAFLSRTKYLHKQLKNTYPTFVGVREHTIVSLTPSDSELPLPKNPECLSRPQIKQLIKYRNMDIDINLFPELKDLRNAVVNYMEDPECYKTFEQRYKAKHAVDAAFLGAMDLLNADKEPEPLKEVKEQKEEI